MNFERFYTISEIATLTQSEILNPSHLELRGINEIHNVRQGDVTFCDHPKYMETALRSAASCIIVNERLTAPKDKALLYNDKPFQAYNFLVKNLRASQNLALSVHPLAHIHPTAVIEVGAVVAARVVIGAHSVIGANAVIYDDVVIGDNVRIGSNTIIGSEAFYFKREAEGFEKWQSGGRVIIHDNVDIGALCTINKGVSTDTTIGEGTKIDCQVHVGHDARIGARCLIAAQVGISGNVHLEDDVVLYGQVGVAQNIHIGAGAIVLAQSGISKNLDAGKKYFGYPAQEMTTAYRELAALRRLVKK